MFTDTYVLFTIDTIPLWFDYYLNEGEFIKRQTTMHHAIFDWLKKVYSCVKSTWKVDVEFKSLVHNLKWLFNRFFFPNSRLAQKRRKGLNSKRKQWIHTYFFSQFKKSWLKNEPKVYFSAQPPLHLTQYVRAFLDTNESFGWKVWGWDVSGWNVLLPVAYRTSQPWLFNPRHLIHNFFNPIWD